MVVTAWLLSDRDIAVQVLTPHRTQGWVGSAGWSPEEPMTLQRARRANLRLSLERMVAEEWGDAAGLGEMIERAMDAALAGAECGGRLGHGVLNSG